MEWWLEITNIEMLFLIINVENNLQHISPFSSVQYDNYIAQMGLKMFRIFGYMQIIHVLLKIPAIGDVTIWGEVI